MADPQGFLNVPRDPGHRRPVDIRLSDWREVAERPAPEVVSAQASRCMDCGVPFCHNGCPLGNLIPDWNDLVYRGRWDDALARLHATNNFPEFTGRLCPAPCEGACVLEIRTEPVTIKKVEQEIIDRAFDDGRVRPATPAPSTGRSVAVVGSGPAGLAAAQQLTRAGHAVTVFERADRIGGLLRYGIPEFKMEKQVLDRRLEQMRAEGTTFVTEASVGGEVSVAELRARFDAIVLAIGSTVPRDLPVPGRELAGIYPAMDYLVPSNRAAVGDGPSPISAAGKDVVIIGGGDTGADCLGTAHRQGAASVTQLEIMPTPPEARAASTPWPTYPLLLRTSSAHEEGGERVFAVSTVRFNGEREVTSLTVTDVQMVEGRPTAVPGTERDLPAQLVLLAMGFTGVERSTLIDGLGVDVDDRGRIARDGQFVAGEGIFVAGDAGRGQSLIVWAIAEGRAAAAAVDDYLMGSTTLPAPIEPTTVSLT